MRSIPTRAHAHEGRRTARLAAVCFAVGAGLFFFSVQAPGVSANSHGDDNRGDVWVDNVGQPAGPGHEMDPHLACANINLWGNDLADSSGSYTIDGWQPSGFQETDYASTWTYNGSGDQVTSVIDVHTLLANAIASGDTPQAQQGYHFKLQFSQDPQKHKTFWVRCPAPSTPTPTGTPTANPTPTPHGCNEDNDDSCSSPNPCDANGSHESNNDNNADDNCGTPTPAPTPSESGNPTPTPKPSPTGNVSGCSTTDNCTPTPTPTPTPKSTGDPTPTGGVQALTTGNPDTGAHLINTGFIGLVLMIAGMILFAARRVLRHYQENIL